MTLAHPAPGGSAGGPLGPRRRLSAPPGDIPLSGRSELVSLAERMDALAALRLSVWVVVLLAAALAPEVAGSRTGLAVLVAVWAGVQAVIEISRRVARGGALGLVGAAVLVDGAFVATALYRTGGPGSYLAFLVELHVIGVSLLVSYRTGLKLSLWYTLLFSVGHYLLRAGFIEGVSPGRPVALGFARSEVFGLLSFWLVSAATAAFSSLSERELRRGQAQLRSLAELGAATAERLDGDRVPELLLEHLCDTFEMRRGVVMLTAPDGLRVHTAETTASGAPAGRGWRSRLRRRDGRVSRPEVTSSRTCFGPASPELAAWPDPVVAATEASHLPVLLRRLGSGNPLLSRLLPGAERVAEIPLLAEGQSLGIVAVERGGSTITGLPVRTLEMLGQFGAHAALSLRNATLHAEVGRLARTDPLTGLANRRTFDEALAREVARARRLGSPLALVMVDIDHFKRVNDGHGHQVGDEVLRHVGRVLGGVTRAADVSGRLGGEEFAILLPDSDGPQAVLFAERVRATISEESGRSGPVQVAASAGVAVLSGADTDPDDLVRLADMALYRAKRNGRDRVEWASRQGWGRALGAR